MAKSDARFGYRADLKRQDHNVSEPFTFTCAPGMLLPIWYDFANPGDTFYMQHDMPLLRSINLLAPAMVDVKIHYETFFVPIQMIYQPFENSYFGLKPILSNLYVDSVTLGRSGLPLFKYADFVSNLKTASFVKSNEHADAFRLADLFGLCVDVFGDSDVTRQAQVAPSFFPYQIAAYHTIYQYYYRLDDKSEFENQFCNLDRYYNADTFVPNPEFMKIYQRPWDMDFYKSMYRSPIISNANTPNFMDTLSKVDMFEGHGSVSRDGVVPTNASGAHDASTADSADIRQVGSISADSGNAGIQQLRQALGTAAIRQMFAYEKLLMITGRTRKNYDSQVLAHMGFEVPHDVKHDITMIHHDEYDLNVQEVTSLAQTSEAPLGELAGKSYAAGNGKSFKFTAPCHGVMMTIFSIEPKVKYIGGFDRVNAITSVYDFPVQEYDRLGNMPVFRYEVGWNLADSTFTPGDIIGWKERYYFWKRKHPRATVAFDIVGKGTNPYSSYVLAYRPFGTNPGGSDGSGQRQRPDLENRFYIERWTMDQLCSTYFQTGWLDGTSASGEDWSESPWLVYARDPFIVDSYVKSKKISWMSKDGEPIYNF